MKVVVFGGAGFLGSHVADVLTASGYEAIVYDIKKSEYLRPKQKMVIGDILDEDKVNKTIKGSDIVYNFAGITDIDKAHYNPLATINFNILGNTVILEGCRKFKVKRFIYPSSLYVYSNAGSFYRSSKQACELIIEDYHKQYNLEFTILRYGTLYGPRSDEKNWLYSALKQAIFDKNIVRKGDGEEIREYIHVCDAAKLSVMVLDEQYKNQYLIITGNQQIRIKDLMRMIKEILCNKINLEFIESDEEQHYEITPYNFNPKLAKKIFANEYIDLGQGILNLINEIYSNKNST